MEYVLKTQQMSDRYAVVLTLTYAQGCESANEFIYSFIVVIL